MIRQDSSALHRLRAGPVAARQGSRFRLLAFLTLAGLVAVGCTRATYRAKADRDSYAILHERLFDPRWNIPRRSVWPDVHSRLRDAANPDRGPLPPDDPAARRYMLHPYKFAGWKGYQQRGWLPWIEDPSWRSTLPRDREGLLRVGPQNAMPLALLHSREYQTQVEGLYLQALQLSLDRFQFDTQLFAGNVTTYSHVGTSSLPEESNLLATAPAARVQRNLAAGGQLLASFANSFVWEFTGKDVSRSSGGAVVSLTQPLLRGAYKQVALEGLTQSERNVLYAVRSFMRFRRIFYVNVMSGNGGFLGLLAQLQGIRNQQSNLQNLERSLDEYRALYAAGLVSLIEVDTVFQNYQQARFSLLQSQLGFQSALDAYKLILGLPPQLEMAVDDDLLRRFETNAPRLDSLRAENETHNLELLQPEEPPSLDTLRQSFQRLTTHQQSLLAEVRQASAEVAQWQARLRNRSPRPKAAEPPVRPDSAAAADPRGAAKRLRDDQAEHQRQTALAAQLAAEIGEVETKLRQDLADVESAAARLTEQEQAGAWQLLLDQTGKEFRARVGDAFVVQSQVRVYLIELTPLELGFDTGVALAFANRLDLMNQQGLVTDAYRRVEVAGRALRGTLNVRGSANLLTDPAVANPIRFDPSFNRYTLGLEFDSPITRRLERNNFRAAQIAYQQSRRSFMAAQDGVAQSVRNQLRQLEISRFGFEVARLQFVAAVRQVDEAQISLRSNQAGGQTQSGTLLLLQAFQFLLSARNGLIGGWVSYETARMNLFRDLDLMELDERGVWINERDQPAATGARLEIVPAVVAPPGQSAAGTQPGSASGAQPTRGGVPAAPGGSPLPVPGPSGQQPAGTGVPAELPAPQLPVPVPPRTGNQPAVIEPRTPGVVPGAVTTT